MRAFRYRLAPALKRAEHLEHRLQMELARQEHELSRAARHLHILDKLRQALTARVRQLRDGEVDLVRLEDMEHELEQVAALLARAERVRGEVESRVQQTRGRLIEAARSRQLLESHRDGQAQHHRRSEQAAENKQLDDLATVGAAAPRAKSRGAP
jgi:flagellar biosynthesis chaperone FliJ